MTPSEAHRAICLIASDAVRAGTLRCGLAFDDEVGGGDDDEWIRVSVLHLDPRGATLGGYGDRLIDQRGRVIVQAFTARHLGDGSARARNLAQAARDLYHGRSTDGTDTITFGASTVQRIPSTDAWVQFNASIPFTYHERY